VLPVGWVIDRGYTEAAGGAKSALRELGAALNSLNGLFEDQLGVRLQAEHTIVVSDANPQGYTGPNEPRGSSPRPPETGVQLTVKSSSGTLEVLDSRPSYLLGRFSQWVGSAAPVGRAALWHLLTAAFPAPGVLGIASVGVACSPFSMEQTYHKRLESPVGPDYFPRTLDGYAVSVSVRIPTLPTRNTCVDAACSAATGLSSRSGDTWLTIAHELGHNLGGAHTFGLGGRMSYSRDVPFVPNLSSGKLDICEFVSSTVSKADDGASDLTDGCLLLERALCGNGRLEGDEECDDANVVDGDGCSAQCAIECGYRCVMPLGRECMPHCGDGVLEPQLGEECDDDSECCVECRLAPNALCSGGECCDATCTPLLPSATCANGAGFCHRGGCETNVAAAFQRWQVDTTLTVVDTSACPVVGCRFFNLLGESECWINEQQPSLLPDGFACADESGLPGVCQSGVCVGGSAEPTCGDGVIGNTEECDDASACCVGCRLARGAECSPPGACCDVTCKAAPAPSTCAAGYCENGRCESGSAVCERYNNLVFDSDACPMTAERPCVLPCALKAGGSGGGESECYALADVEDGSPCTLIGGGRGVCVSGECTFLNHIECEPPPAPAPSPPPPGAPCAVLDFTVLRTPLSNGDGCDALDSQDACASAYLALAASGNYVECVWNTTREACDAAAVAACSPPLPPAGPPPPSPPRPPIPPGGYSPPPPSLSPLPPPSPPPPPRVFVVPAPIFTAISPSPPPPITIAPPAPPYRSTVTPQDEDGLPVWARAATDWLGGKETIDLFFLPSPQPELERWAIILIAFAAVFVVYTLQHTCRSICCSICTRIARKRRGRHGATAVGGRQAPLSAPTSAPPPSGSRSRCSAAVAATTVGARGGTGRGSSGNGRGSSGYDVARGTPTGSAVLAGAAVPLYSHNAQSADISAAQAELVAMGFSDVAAASALRRTQGDVVAAVDVLTAEAPRQRSPAPAVVGRF